MRKTMAALVALALLNTGCAWLGFGDDSSETQTTVNETAQDTAQAPEAEPATTSKSAEPSATAKTAAKTTVKKGAKSEAQIKAELDKMGQKLAAQSARTLLPNKANKEVKKVGNQWVASYIDVDTQHVTTEMRPGANGQYVGFIRYQERFMECRGDSKQAALSAPCQQVRARNLNELIRYDGREWQD